MEARLVTIHPNPGPENGRGRRSREGRCERRYERRRERRRERNERRLHEMREENERVNGREIVTWNVQGLSVRENRRERLRRVVERIRSEGWEIVCLTELRADDCDVVWMGMEEHKVALVHSRKAGVLLRGEALKCWVEGGMRKEFCERMVAVVIGEMRVVSAYQPIWGKDEAGMEQYRRALGYQLARSAREWLVIGGDFNANVGRGNARQGVCGKYGVGRMNEAGRDLIEWCGENGLSYVNSYMKHERRGTWFNLRYGRWYELDGFIVRKNDRHEMIESMCTGSEWQLSDHRPKVMKVRERRKKWRAQGRGERKVPRVKWEALSDEEKKEEYKQKTRELMQEENGRGEKGWKEMSDVMMTAAKEVCGEVEGRVANPWILGHEERLKELEEGIRTAVNERNVSVGVLKVMGRLRVRADDRRMEEVEGRVNVARERVKETRKEHKRFLRSIEREWWD